MAGFRNSTERYGSVARVLHWLIGLLILAQIVMGFAAFELMERGADRAAVAGSHKALGVLLLIAIAVRLAWRLYDAPPALPGAMPVRIAKAARTGHLLLYVLMVGMPLTGLLLSDFGGRPTDVFGLFQVPTVLPPSEALHDAFEEVHQVGGYLLSALILLHVAAAFWHRSEDKGGVLGRML